MTPLREQLAAALLQSFGGTWYLGKSRALQHADALIAAGFTRPDYLTSQEEVAGLADGAVIERTAPGGAPQFFVRRDGLWQGIDGGSPLADAALGGPGVWLALRRR